MTTPTVRSNLYSSFFEAPGADKSGAVRMIPINTAVTSGEAANTVYELFPFQKGLRVYGITLVVPNMSDGSSTVDVGYVYDSASFTDDVDYFLDGSTACQAGGVQVYPTTVTGGAIGVGAGVAYATEGSGYVTLKLLTSAADATTTITGYALISYGDTLGA